ncbi:hypothetical protein AVEN_238726-1 [Araneus ventricosus]|uniref:Uncharacterized protein n=1 Tax=Araneus ventricosus TaxID=182803 RepID=A0A4Y2GL08_ARAVE|nr:hypothetical protein AVEN_238726-1 [Araneus ventricosus]
MRPQLRYDVTKSRNRPDPESRPPLHPPLGGSKEQVSCHSFRISKGAPAGDGGDQQPADPREHGEPQPQKHSPEQFGSTVFFEQACLQVRAPL